MVDISPEMYHDVATMNNTLLTTYLLLSTVIIGVLYLIWKQSTWINVYIKFILFVTFIFGVIVTYKQFNH
jgi:hypothetical protein